MVCKRWVHAEVGVKYGRWTVLANAPESKFWLCECSCGVIKRVQHNYLRSGRSLSCIACSKTKHGHCKSGFRNPKLREQRSREYRTWRCMRRRAGRASGYETVTVCERWSGPDCFPKFLADMGMAPSENHWIERINCRGNYEPSNCRWATVKEQMRNRSSSVLVEFQGKTQCISAWAEELNIDPHLLYRRFSNDWTPERAFSEPNMRGIA